MGRYEVWDAIGVEKSVKRMERELKEVPELTRYLLEKDGARSTTATTPAGGALRFLVAMQARLAYRRG